MWKAHVYPPTSSQLLEPGLGLPRIPFQKWYSPRPPPPPTHPANFHCQIQTGPMNNKADVGIDSGWESPASFKGTSLMSVSPSAAPTQRHVTTPHRLSGKEVTWLNGLMVCTATSGHKGASIVAAPMASILAEYRAAPGRSPKLLLPPNKSSMHSESQGFPHWKSHKVPLASTKPAYGSWTGEDRRFPHHTVFLCGTGGKASTLPH